MNFNVVSAIFRRNFNSYFANPTGYVFICVYVLLSSFAAFWPNDFFSSNLANLDQLNRYLPYIMLVFIPAITMSIWAEERRQGTDELLLTIPAADFDVVLGKYLAAVAIYSVALLFSMICNLSVLSWLAYPKHPLPDQPVGPDLGLFFGTYFGYWLVGAAMLSIGMVASFLTGNLTVGFVLGTLFNAPLAFAANADVIMPAEWAIPVKQWSLEEQFRDFGRGVVSLSGVSYFVLTVVVMLYLSMVLIGRRHWQGGKDGLSLGPHYLLRGGSLIGIAVGVVMILQHFDLRADVTAEGLSSLSPKTRELLGNLKRTVKIDAYISPEVPESYVKTRLDLLSMLREFAARGKNLVRLRIHDTKPLSPEAQQAEQQFNITPQPVFSRTRGAVSREQIYMGVAFTSGLEKVVVPFLGPAVPVEYELARSIATVSEEKRQKLGVLVTDAKLYASFNMQTFTQGRNDLLIDELEKQYDVVQVNADTPVKDDIDVLFAVQPSSLSPEQMKNFVAAVKRGIPTAIFEDPLSLTRDVPGTTAPKRPPQQMMMFGGQQPLPKGDIRELWKLLGIEFEAHELVCQYYNPYPKLELAVTPEWLFIDAGASEDKKDHPVFSQKDPISSGLQQVLLLYAGSLKHLNASDMKFEPLLQTGDETAEVAFSDLQTMNPFGGGGGLNPNPRRKPTRDYYTLAAHITGKLPEEDAEETAKESEADEKKDGDKEEKKKRTEINAVVVADIDLFYQEFFQFRQQSQDPDRELDLSLDNITFTLNVLDALAGDDRFIDIRKRRLKHRVLATIEEKTKDAKVAAEKEKLEKRKDLEEATAKEQAELDKRVSELKKRGEKMNTIELMQRLQILEREGNQRLDARKRQLQKDLDQKVTKIERDLNLQVTREQDWYKMWAVVLPPILPMLVGLGVFFNRRAHEREGVARSRLR
ncbi:MAG TPA: Gldg family protein [Pirellulales bacterium]|nr:Gldg family protein [Pirellulales bacterium]